VAALVSVVMNRQVLHDQPFYLGCPDVLSLVGYLFRETGVVHRITYSFSYSPLTYIFVYLIIIDIKNGVLYPIKQLNHFLVNAVTALYSLTYTTPVRDCRSHWTSSVRYPLPTVSPFKCLPVQPLLPITKGSERTLTD
jgi:hypothetical protein